MEALLLGGCGPWLVGLRWPHVPVVRLASLSSPTGGRTHPQYHHTHTHSHTHSPKLTRPFTAQVKLQCQVPTEGRHDPRELKVLFVSKRPTPSSPRPGQALGLSCLHQLNRRSGWDVTMKREQAGSEKLRELILPGGIKRNHDINVAKFLQSRPFRDVENLQIQKCPV